MHQDEPRTAAHVTLREASGGAKEGSPCDEAYAVIREEKRSDKGNSFSRDAQESNENKLIGEQLQTAKKVNSLQVERNENVQDMQNLKHRNNQEIFGVNLAWTSDKKIFQNNSDINFQEKQSKPKNSEWPSQDVVPSSKELMEFHKQVQEIKESVPDKLKSQNTANQLGFSKEEEKTQEKIANNMNSPKTDLSINKPFEYSLHNSANDTEETISAQISNSEAIIVLEEASDNMHNPIETEKNKPNEVESPLPDILSTFHQTIRSKRKTTNTAISSNNESPLFDSPTNEKSQGIQSPSISLDTEAEFKRLQSLRTNQSIYKLAYDESQSEADSRSPSPVDPETQVPRSLINDEILIHEADSCSDAGSEDVELLPHRYESETFLKESKHMYVNKLSLAVELLRTQESLPYDDQFKRVSGENLKETDAVGEDSSSFEPLHNVITSQSQTSNSRNSTAVSSFSFQDVCNESCDEAKEVVVEAAKTRDNTEEVRAGSRRFQVQFRHYLTPRAALVNPCLCCVIT